MKYSIENNIGQEVKRTSFLLKRADGEYHFLFGIIERLEDDAPENVLRQKQSKTYCDEKADGKKDKIFVETDFVTLDQTTVNEPWKCYVVDGTNIKVDGKGYQWKNNGENNVIPSNRDEKTELMVMVPDRRCSAFVKYCKPQEPSDAMKTVLDSDGLKEQLKSLSERLLGYDLNIHKCFLDCFMLVCYNPICKDIGFIEDAQEAGVYIRVNYRGEQRPPLHIRVQGLSREGDVLGIEDFWFQGEFLNRMRFKKRYPLLEIVVLDEDGDVLDNFKNLTFIHSIQLGMSVKSKDVALLDENSNVVRVVEKFSKERPSTIGAKIEEESVWDNSQEFEYEKLERSLDFVFFDGEKEKTDQNRQKARGCVERILNQTQNVCYICDSYFNVKTLCQFVAPIKFAAVEVRVLSSKERLGADDKEKLKQKAEEMRVKDISNVHCRLLKGEKSALHDRFIVADDKVWMLGCSLNEFGERATTLIRVPSRYSKRLIEWAENYWNNDDLTEAL